MNYFARLSPATFHVILRKIDFFWNSEQCICVWTEFLKEQELMHCLKYSLKLQGLNNHNKTVWIHKYEFFLPISPVSYPSCVRALASPGRNLLYPEKTNRLWSSRCYYYSMKFIVQMFKCLVRKRKLKAYWHLLQKSIIVIPLVH